MAEDKKEESEQPEQRLLLNVPIRARHSSTDIMTTATKTASTVQFTYRIIRNMQAKNAG